MELGSAKFIEENCVKQEDPNPEIRIQAERVLLEFRKSLQPYKICFQLLSHSKEPRAQFTAISTLREAILREWTSLGAKYVQEIRFTLLKYILEHGELVPFVVNQGLHVVSVITKRAWFSTPLSEAKLTGSSVSSAPSGQQIAVFNCDFLLSQIDSLLLTSAPSSPSSPSPSISISTRAMACLRLCQNVVSEFSCTQCSALGLSWDYHVRAHRSFEKLVLQRIFTSVYKILAKVSSESQIGLIGGCLGVIEQILNWEFDEKASSSSLQLRALVLSSPDITNRTLITPGPLWTQLLLNGQFIGNLLRIYQGVVSSLKPDVARLCRQIFIQLASLSGTIFPTSSTSPSSSPFIPKEGFLAQLLKSASALCGLTINRDSLLKRVPSSSLSPPSSSASSSSLKPAQIQLLKSTHGDEMIALCQYYQRIIFNFHLSLILSLPDSLVSDFFTQLSNLTRLLLSYAMEGGEETWPNEALDVLIDGWVILVTDFEQDGRKYKQAKQDEIGKKLEAYTTSVFSLYVEKLLTRAQREALKGEEQDQFYDKTYIHERLNAIALIARINGYDSLKLLSENIAKRTSLLKLHLEIKKQSSSPSSPQQRIPPAVIQEQLYWLIYLMGHVLADDVEGEQPLIPNHMMLLSLNPKYDPDPLLSASTSVFQLVELHNQLIENKIRNELLSPLIEETLLWFLRRWTASYLMPDEALYGRLSPRLLLTFGATEGKESQRMIEFLVNKARINLLLWTEEDDVTDKTCDLLYILVQSKRIRIRLTSTKSWQMIVEYFCRLAETDSSSGQSTLACLKGSILTRLVQALVQASTESVSVTSHRTSFASLVTPISLRFKNLLQRVEKNKQLLIDTRLMDNLLMTLHMIHGVAKADGPHTLDLVFDFMASHFGVLIKLVELYGPIASETKHSIVSSSSSINREGGLESEKAMANDILKIIFCLFTDMAETEIAFLSSIQSKVFFEAVLALIQKFGVVNQKRLVQFQDKKITSIETNLKEEDQFEDLQALLLLLTHLISKDTTDFSQDNTTFASDAVLKGLCCLLPHVSVNMLQYPAICSLYYQLLQDLITTYPQKVSMLPTEIRDLLLNSIAMALSHHQTAIVKLGLQALSAVATYHLKETQRITRAKKSSLSPSPDLSVPTTPFEKNLTSFLVLLFKLLLFQTISPDILDILSDTLLPLILSSPKQYPEIIKTCVTEWQKAHPKESSERLVKGFQGLTKNNNIQPNLERANKQNFRKNVREFTADIRAYLQQK